MTLKCVAIPQQWSEKLAEPEHLTMDSRADMRNVTTILLSEDSSPVGTVGTATWAIAPAKEKQGCKWCQCPCDHMTTAPGVHGLRGHHGLKF